MKPDGRVQTDERNDIMGVTFTLGNVVATRNVWELIETNEKFSQFVTICMSRYIANDWGEMDKEDLEANDYAVRNGERLLASYQIPLEVEEVFEDRLWIITEWDRSVTTLLFPGDY